MQLTSFCSSWILAVSSLTVSWFSINLLLEDSAIRDSWTLFNSSISWRLLTWASRRFRFCFDSCSWKSNWSSNWCRLELFITCNSMINLSSLGLNNSIQFLATSSIRIGLNFVLLDLDSNISENLLFFAAQGESWFFRFPCRDLIFVFEANWLRIRVSPY